MHTNDAPIHHDIFKVGIFREKLEDALEGSALDPAAKPLKHRIPMAKLVGKVAPGRAGACDPQNRFDEKTAVAAGLPRITPFAQTMRRDGVPLRICQNQSIQTLKSNLS